VGNAPKRKTGPRPRRAVGDGDRTGSESGRLLIVEPEPLLRWSLVTYLSRWFEVFPAESESAADRLLDEQPMDAVVVSDQLPNHQAEEIEAHARSRNAAARVIRTVTTVDDPRNRCIEKPFELSKLAGLLGVKSAAGGR